MYRIRETDSFKGKYIIGYYWQPEADKLYSLIKHMNLKMSDIIKLNVDRIKT